MINRSYVLLAASVLLLTGCAPREVIREAEEDTYVHDLHRYEREFNPSDYNIPPAVVQEDDEYQPADPFRIPETEEDIAPEYIQGFRIQLFSTSDIEAAQEVYRYADSLFTEHWVYIVFEVPFYKVRLGDFENRPQANRMLADVTRRGFRDAWVVPDRVLKNPPQKLMEEEIDLNDENERHVIPPMN